MNKLLAKSIIKNKFYIVEDCGTQIATIQLSPEGASFVQGDHREKFASIKLLEAKYNIVFNNEEPVKKLESINDVDGYPVDGDIADRFWDVNHHVPVYIKSKNSKSIYCAGYYLIKYNKSWVLEFCPKIITIRRYEFRGPYQTQQQAQTILTQL